MAARGFIGAGDLYTELIIGGVYQGLKGPFECNKFEVKPNTESKELVSKGKYTSGQVIESVTRQLPASFTVEINERDRQGLTMSLLGSLAAISQTAGSLTAEVLVAKLGAWVQASKKGFTGVQTLTHASGSPTYVVGVDYLVNKTTGWIQAITGGAITDAQSLRLTTTYQAFTGALIRGATQPDIRARFILDGVNAVDNLPSIVTVHEGIVAADAALDFLSEDFGVLSLPGKMKTPAGFTEPFTVELRDVIS